MLLSLKDYNRDQLLSDLVAARDKISAGWVKRAFSRNDSVCIIGALQTVLGTPVGSTLITESDLDNEVFVRLARAVTILYKTLLGPNAPLDITMSAAMSKIMNFNDTEGVPKASVLLLFDKAIQAALAPVEQS